MLIYSYNSESKSFSVNDLGESPSIRAHMKEGAKVGAGVGATAGAALGAVGDAAALGTTLGAGTIAGGMLGAAKGAIVGGAAGLATGTYRKAKYHLSRMAPKGPKKVNRDHFKEESRRELEREHDHQSKMRHALDK